VCSERACVAVATVTATLKQQVVLSFPVRIRLTVLVSEDHTNSAVLNNMSSTNDDARQQEGDLVPWPVPWGLPACCCSCYCMHVPCMAQCSLLRACSPVATPISASNVVTSTVHRVHHIPQGQTAARTFLWNAVPCVARVTFNKEFTQFTVIVVCRRSSVLRKKGDAANEACR
jgi:hypothetical protein